MAFLSISNLYKSFGQTHILEGINLEIEKGEFCVLLGPSGCGKSTLLNTIAGLTEITGGSIHIDEKNVNDLKPSERDIAMVFQTYALYPTMNVEKNMRFGLEMRKTPKNEIQEKIENVSKILQIQNLLDRKPAQLSGGQRQRVAMGRAIVRDPKIFLFDEPLSNLDAKLRVDMRAEIHNLHRRLGATIVYVTHDQIEAMTLADKIALLFEGRILQIGSPKDMYFNPIDKFTASFIGSPSISFIEGVAGSENDRPTVKLTHNNKDIHVEIKSPPKNFSDFKDKNVILGVRPEWIQFSESADEISQSGFTPIPVELDFAEMAGADTLMFFKIAGFSLLCSTDSVYTDKFQSGKSYYIGIDTKHSIIFDRQSEKNMNYL